MVTKASTHVVKADTLTAANLAASSVGASELQANAVAATHVQNRVLTNLKLALATITSAELADDCVTSAKINDGAIQEGHFANVSVPTAAIKLLAVGAAQLAEDAVTAAKLADDAVASANIQDGAVLAVHLASGIIADPVIAVDAISLTKLKKPASNGSLVYTDASGDKIWKALGPPTVNSVLSWNTTTTEPVWSPSTIFTGVVIDYVGTVAPSGWVLANGKTVGNGSSGATGRASSDCQDLFTLLWNNGFTVTPSKGASAAADWAANRAVALPDLRGRATFGRDGMDNSSSLRVPVSLVTNSLATDAVGAVGGTGSFMLTTDTLPAHRHFLFHSPVAVNNTAPFVSPTQHASYSRTGDTGGASYIMAGNASNAEPSMAPSGVAGTGGVDGVNHPNMPPFLTVTKLIKL